ncbi:amidinotransferase [Paraneptunicella aestuarii]|uniref:arginine deiminase-related protein n=1 Tax=Paraneptunicella aestuarii TaxID=2831148 RepID=UPI001E3AA66E|nr:arginine deiminase-related protein [Paraneptunicella aestuarii]UAA40417.1 amidinotransferase [Paraneptunicella aestuarii]
MPVTGNDVYLTDTVVMVPPQCFAFNSETGLDNEFQHQVNMTSAELLDAAMTEFNVMVQGLQAFGVNVLVFDDAQEGTPDAVFPNNWFSTDSNGNLYLYPMACENRQKEVRPELLIQCLEAQGYKVKNVIDIRSLAVEKAKLEGTGAMVFDHKNNRVYAAISQRCNHILLEQCAQRLQVSDVVAFDTNLSSGKPVYHTNVMLSVGIDYAIICSEVIPDSQREQVLDSLKGKNIVEIDEAQLAAFCGNVLQLKNKDGKPCLTMSKTAFEAFSEEQKVILQKSGELLSFDVSHIEKVGGGSVRCMLAEVFL